MSLNWPFKGVKHPICFCSLVSPEVSEIGGDRVVQFSRVRKGLAYSPAGFAGAKQSIAVNSSFKDLVLPVATIVGNQGFLPLVFT